VVAEPLYYHEFDPSPELSGHLASFWGVEVREVEPGHIHQVIPDGCVGIIASRRADGGTRLTLQGPRLDPLWIPVSEGDRFWGVRFWPDAGAAVVGVPARALLGALQPADAVFGPATASLASSLADCRDSEESRAVWEAALRPLVLRSKALDRLVRTAVLAIVASRGEAPLGELASAVALSPRQLQRRFSDAVGLSPKQFARVRRLRSALQHLVSDSPMGWSAVAADLGFADQAHLIREFVALAGATPVEVAQRLKHIGHGQVRP
jgi:AraC-like DNA-binding protein